MKKEPKQVYISIIGEHEHALYCEEPCEFGTRTTTISLIAEPLELAVEEIKREFVGYEFICGYSPEGTIAQYGPLAREVKAKGFFEASGTFEKKTEAIKVLGTYFPQDIEQRKERLETLLK